jgi:hypothetical protein
MAKTSFLQTSALSALNYLLAVLGAYEKKKDTRHPSIMRASPPLGSKSISHQGNKQAPSTKKK